METSKLSQVVKIIGQSALKIVLFVLKVFGTVFLVVTPLGFLQIAVEKHWLWGFPVIAFLCCAVILGIRDYREGRVNTWQGISALCSMLLITIVIFAFISLALNRFGAAHYQGFPPPLINETRYVLGSLVSFYTWQLFEVIPGVRVNEALGFSTPLDRSGIVAGVLVLVFRVVIVFIILDVFRKWWLNRGKISDA